MEKTCLRQVLGVEIFKRKLDTVNNEEPWVELCLRSDETFFNSLATANDCIAYDVKGFWTLHWRQASCNHVPRWKLWECLELLEEYVRLPNGRNLYLQGYSSHEYCQILPNGHVNHFQLENLPSGPLPVETVPKLGRTKRTFLRVLVKEQHWSQMSCTQEWDPCAGAWASYSVRSGESVKNGWIRLPRLTSLNTTKSEIIWSLPWPFKRLMGHSCLIKLTHATITCHKDLRNMRRLLSKMCCLAICAIHLLLDNWEFALFYTPPAPYKDIFKVGEYQIWPRTIVSDFF